MRGTIIQCAPPRDIYATPASRTVAELVGSPPINILDIEVHGTTIVLPGGRGVPVPAPHMAWLAHLPPRFHIGTRPEHLYFTAEPGLACATVRQVEHLGKEIHVLLDAGAYTLTMQTDAHRTVQPGEIVWWSWDWAHLLCFDPHDGTRIV